MAPRKPEEQKLRDEQSGPVLDSLADEPEATESDRVSLAPLDPETALRALLRTPPKQE